MIWIGVDPGAKGGWAITDGQTVEVYPWDDQKFVESMEEAVKISKCVAAVEKVGARPGQGVTSMFSFGQSFGFILGVLTAFGIGYQLVSPMKWKSEFGLLHTDKRASVYVAKRMFPRVSFMPTGRSRKESDGMSDAALIMEYARRKF